ncbi:hypothetical protein [Frateuria sp. STR12]|uniref:hypothetical protein n=1 Tax=Frateuria hangzhouensis TaxID=2995589 RepID=UPI00226089BB|nr:hypothetical protein [Frateuria sp. STR12]MCX7512601.1 hypothetical protein [Frateuria sp. STR12]
MKAPACLLAALLVSSLAAASPALAGPSDTPMAAVPAAPELDAALRSLWHGHAVHTRDYALAVHAHDTAKAQAAADAVVANAKQIAGAVAGFYGQPAGAKMLDLLAGHWGGVKALTDARAANDQPAEQKAMGALDSNAQAIAVFLSTANPNLPERAVKDLLTTHVAHHSTQIEQIMSGDMQGERSTWQAMQAHMDMISDALAGAIAKQFPDKAS